MKPFEFDKVSDLLMACGDLVSGNPELWAQGWQAYNMHGGIVSPFNENACKWCMEGFLIAAPKADNITTNSINRAITAAIKNQSFNDVWDDDIVYPPRYNDVKGRKPKDVYTIFYKAAEIAKNNGL